MTRLPPADQRPGPDPSADRPSRQGPRPLTDRQVGVVVLVWTVVVGTWFALAVADGGIRPATLLPAVGVSFGVLWLLGLLVLGSFLIRGE